MFVVFQTIEANDFRLNCLFFFNFFLLKMTLCQKWNVLLLSLTDCLEYSECVVVFSKHFLSSLIHFILIQLHLIHSLASIEYIIKPFLPSLSRPHPLETTILVVIHHSIYIHLFPSLSFSFLTRYSLFWIHKIRLPAKVTKNTIARNLSTDDLTVRNKKPKCIQMNLFSFNVKISFR